MEDGADVLSIFNPLSSIFAFGDSSRIAMITAPISAAVSNKPITSNGRTNFVIRSLPICSTVADGWAGSGRLLAKL